jgi:hypothetical protein
MAKTLVEKFSIFGKGRTREELAIPRMTISSDADSAIELNKSFD